MAEDGDEPNQEYTQQADASGMMCSAWADSYIVNFASANSDPDDDDGCLHGRTRAFAEEACAADGARLCTADEIVNRCTAGTGCGHDGAVLWSSSPCADAPTVRALPGRLSSLSVP